MSAFRVCPTDQPSTTRMEFDYYNLDSGDKFEEYYNFVRQVALEDYELCETAQYNLEKGIYVEGILNPVKETGVACTLVFTYLVREHAANIPPDYQQRVLEMVLEQHQKEQRRARQASPEIETETGSIFRVQA